MTNVSFPNAELVSAQILRPKAVSSMASELLLADPIRGHDVAVAVPSSPDIALCSVHPLFFCSLSLDIAISLGGVWKARGAQCPHLGVWNREDKVLSLKQGWGWKQLHHAQQGLVSAEPWNGYWAMRQGVQIKNLSVHILSNERSRQTLTQLRASGG